jgi:hypothetical protein
MTDVNPIKYTIHLEPDLKNFRFAGSTEILLDAVKPVSETILNILELAIWNCKVRVGDSFVDCPFYVNPIEQFHPLHYERVIAGIIPVCGLGREDEVTAFFKDYMHKKSMARDAIKLSLEKLEINS